MLQVSEVSIAGYRSLKAIHFPVGPLTVFVGANGVGKTNLYRALELIQAAAAGTLARELAAEGGFESAFWAGTRHAREPVRITLGVRLEEGGPHAKLVQRYEVETGLVQQAGASTFGAAFSLEPQIKAETLTHETGRRSIKLLERKGPAGFVIDGDGVRQPFGTELLATETTLAALQDAGAYPDLHLARRTMLHWRFYHQVRTDAGSPLRRPCLAVTTPTLSSNGADLAAVFATLAHIRGDTTDLDAAVDDAFPGARLVIPVPERHASFGLVFPDYPRRVRGLRAVGRDPAFPGSGRGAARLPATVLHRAERARSEPTSQHDGPARPSHRRGLAPKPDLARHPFRAPRRNDCGDGRHHAAPRDQTRRRHLDRGLEADRGFRRGLT
jgi:predicted ATPase